MDTVTPVGVSWGEYYRALGIVALFIVVASLADLPLFATINPLFFSTTALALFAVSTVYQLARNLNQLLRSVIESLRQYLL
jgi:predicted membrane channel-forming protein YqfA (hemolysin III family)